MPTHSFVLFYSHIAFPALRLKCSSVSISQLLIKLKAVSILNTKTTLRLKYHLRRTKCHMVTFRSRRSGFFLHSLSRPFVVCGLWGEEGLGVGGMLTSIIFHLKDVEIGNALLNNSISVLRDRGSITPVSIEVQLLGAGRVTPFRELAYPNYKNGNQFSKPCP